MAPRRAAPHRDTSTKVPLIVHEVLRSPGRSLDSAMRKVMESRFGRDLSDVRVHSDARAAESALAIDAAAYTVGHHVVFGANRWVPSGTVGQRLLAHEIAHVLQQGGAGTVGASELSLGEAGDAHELQADLAADQVVEARGTPTLGAVHRAVVQRQAGGASPAFTPKPATAPPPAAKLPSLSDLLTVKIGPVTIELPKSIAARLPISLSAAKTLVVEFRAEAPASFSFRLTIDGTPHVRVSASASAEYDVTKGAATGTAGLRIESVRTVCHATNPEDTRSSLTRSGEKLLKAAQEWSAAADAESKLSKLIDLVSALGAMYDAVEKAKAKCKQVPRWTLQFGVTGPLGTDDVTDPSKRAPTTIGATLSFPF